MSRKIMLIAALALITAAGAARAQAPAQPAAAPTPPPQYGLSISVADAKKAAAAAIAEVGKIGSLPDAVAIVDPGGYLVYFERMENTQIGSVQFAIDKARSAVLFRRPTKVFEDILAGGRMAILALHGAVPLEGGVLIIEGGKIVGAIGASGGTGQQDGVVAAAGAGAVK
jgi:glc operon protein GlcG